MQLEGVGCDGASEEDGGKGWGLTRVDPRILQLKWEVGLGELGQGCGVDQVFRFLFVLDLGL